MKKKIRISAFFVVLLTVFGLYGCSTPQRAFPINYNYEDDCIQATILSAKKTDRITVNGKEEYAPSGNAYVTVDLKMKVKSGNWNEIQNFVVSKLEKFSFDQFLTNQLTGFDVLTFSGIEEQKIHLAFLVTDDSEPIDYYTFRVEYSDKGCSQLFTLTDK